MSKKVPLKTKEKGIVGKPAEPTVAPGGSVAAAAWVAGRGGCAAAEAAGVADEPAGAGAAAGARAARRRSQRSRPRAAAASASGPGRRRR